MKRDLYEILCQWKNDKNRRPLLVRGARQVGKTFLVNEFGRREFDSLVTLNFERNPEYREIFNSLEPRNILEKITLFTGKRIEPGKTLIFFDEVQDCASAIMASASQKRVGSKISFTSPDFPMHRPPPNPTPSFHP